MTLGGLPLQLHKLQPASSLRNHHFRHPSLFPGLGGGSRDVADSRDADSANRARIARDQRRAPAAELPRDSMRPVRGVKGMCRHANGAETKRALPEAR
jgi:hypothetical protein